MYKIIIEIDENKGILDMQSTHASLYLEEKINMPKLYFKHIKNICSKNKFNPKLIDLLCLEDFMKLARGMKWTEVKPNLYDYVSIKFKK